MESLPANSHIDAQLTTPENADRLIVLLLASFSLVGSGAGWWAGYFTGRAQGALLQGAGFANTGAQPRVRRVAIHARVPEHRQGYRRNIDG